MPDGGSPQETSIESTHQPLPSLDLAGLPGLNDLGQNPDLTSKCSQGEGTAVGMRSIFSGSTDNTLTSLQPELIQTPPLDLSVYNGDWFLSPNNSASDDSQIRTETPSITVFPGTCPLPSLNTADTLPQNISAPNTLDATSTLSCQCTQTALSILEALETDNNQYNHSTFDHILGLKKKAISQCSLSLACPRCSAASTFVVLLIVVSEKILTSFEAWSTRYQGRKLEALSDSSRTQSKICRLHETETVTLGVYEVDSDHERCSLLRSLAMVQVRRFYRLLNGLQRVAATQNWRTHQASLESFVHRLDEAAARLIDREFSKLMD